MEKLDWKIVSLYLLTTTVAFVITTGIFGVKWDNQRIANKSVDITELLENISEQGGIVTLEAGVYKITRPQELSYIRLSDDDDGILPENQFILNLFDSATSYKFDLSGDKETGVKGTLTLYYGGLDYKCDGVLPEGVGINDILQGIEGK